MSSPEAPLAVPDSAGPAGARPEYVARFAFQRRALHFLLMTCFLGLAATGLPLLFSDAAWAPVLARLFGGFAGAGLVHRFLGTTLLAAMVWHLAEILWRGAVRREKGLFWGPTSMVPQPRDLFDLLHQIRWFIGKGPRPRFEHFTYWEKFDYWAVLWGTFLMGTAGLVLWFPMAASRVLPGWMFNIALYVHGAEATLAIVFIFVVHFFNGHLRPGKFPMDMVIFTGAVEREELRHERADQYDRLVREGALDRLSVRSPSRRSLRRGRIIGTVGLVTGLGLFVLILYAVLQW